MNDHSSGDWSSKLFHCLLLVNNEATEWVFPWPANHSQGVHMKMEMYDSCPTEVHTSHLSSKVGTPHTWKHLKRCLLHHLRPIVALASWIQSSFFTGMRQTAVDLGMFHPWASVRLLRKGHGNLTWRKLLETLSSHLLLLIVTFLPSTKALTRRHRVGKSVLFVPIIHLQA